MPTLSTRRLLRFDGAPDRSPSRSHVEKLLHGSEETGMSSGEFGRDGAQTCEPSSCRSVDSTGTAAVTWTCQRPFFFFFFFFFNAHSRAWRVRGRDERLGSTGRHRKDEACVTAGLAEDCRRRQALDLHGPVSYSGSLSTRAAMILAIGNAAVAAGDGALSTCTVRGVSANMKSCARVPSLSTAWARMPAG